MKYFLGFILGLVILAIFWIATNQYYLNKVRKYKLTNGQRLSDFIEQKYKTKSHTARIKWTVRHDGWFLNSIITCEINDMESQKSIVLMWESEGTEIRASTNRTREITPVLAPPCATLDIEYDQRFNPFFICDRGHKRRG